MCVCERESVSVRTAYETCPFIPRVTQFDQHPGFMLTHLALYEYRREGLMILNSRDQK